ncbi:MAG: MogA/MoaB family molybdenum cofactor biosynthesis protein [Planctomycetia bacterium]|nr:MogA/MoaB family molybdenum cofactor biosynthesis protein [Planctomycetia bacterium]
MQTSEQHKTCAKKQYPRVSCAIITVSDTRNEGNDTSGQTIRDFLIQDNHPVASYSILKDEPAEIVKAVQTLAAKADVEAILLNGGTGIGRRDSTVEAIGSLLEKTLVGFGEIFRMISYGEIGAAAMLSRAVAGVYQGKLIFSMPGSTHAVKLAMEKLILPELAHLVWEIKK